MKMILLHQTLVGVYSALSSNEPPPKRPSICDAIGKGDHKQRIFLWGDPVVAPSGSQTDMGRLNRI
ncbi:hypothetical protein WB44_05830 [Synechococcus sp. WH 8020]|nr:hypothetical protein WB44_05830 [Synechococcus sp. WH 8020]